MKYFLFSLFLTTQAFSQETVMENSWGVGNGGDWTVCQNNSLLEGAFSYDFAHEVVKYGETSLFFENIESDRPSPQLNFTEILNPNLDLGQHFLAFGMLRKDINNIEQHVLNLLGKHSKKLADNLTHFYQNKLKINHNIKWISVDKVFEIDDEENSTLLEYNCIVRQIAIRKIENDKTIFYYSPFDVLVIQMWPLQESFFFIHEWLWSYLDSAQKVRDVNWFLHSKEATKLTTSEFLNRLKTLGVSI